MPRLLLSRILMATLVLVLLSAPSAVAEETNSPRRDASRFYSLADIFERAWGGLVNLWANNGAEFDPSGGDATLKRETSSEQAADNGAEADPNGRPGS